MGRSAKPQVSIVLGSDTDLPAMQDATEILDEFAVEYEVRIVSAHRSPELAHDYARTLEERGVEVVIAAAGGAAHLAGVVAGLTALPVIGIPLATPLAGGLDSFLSTLQMPSGVPVATMAMGKSGPKNAAILAVQILGLKFPALRKKIRDYKAELASKVEKKDKQMRG